MNEQSPDNMPIDLSSLDFGPKWARSNDEPKKTYKEYKGGQKEGRRPRRENRSGGYKGGRDSGARKPRKRRFVPAAPAEGIKGAIMPVEVGVDNLSKEITASGRTYSVFDLARAVLGSRDRFNILFSKAEGGPDMYQGKKDDCVFLTKEECLQHAGNAEWFGEVYLSENIEVEPPKGNFQTIAKCGFSGVILGPTNFHGYQEKVAELHRTEFSNMSLESYKRRIVTESGEEIVNLWKESMTKRTVFKLASDPSVVLDSKSAALQHFEKNLFEEHFRKTHKALVPSGIEAKKLSPSLLATLKEVLQEQRRYPGELASFLCRQLSGRQLAVFKWQGKLHCGPSRPHLIPEDVVLADRMAEIYNWVDAHQGGGIDELWKGVWPAEIEEEEKLKWYHDLHWLINQGYVIFMNNGHLYPSTASKKPAKKVAQKKVENKAAKKDAQPDEADKVDKAAGQEAAPKTETKAPEPAKEDAKAEAKVDEKTVAKEDAKPDAKSEEKPKSEATSEAEDTEKE